MKVFNNNEINDIKEYLYNGKIVAVPTETVYGLAVKYDDINAVNRLKKLKERENKAFTIMIYNKNDIRKYGMISNNASKIINKFFPGELTLVLPKNSDFKNELFDSSDTIGIRILNHKFMLELLKETGPLVVTSANLKGDKPCINSNEVIYKLPMIDVVVEGASDGNKPSTIIFVDNENIKLLREGPISLDEIMSIL